MKLLRNLSQIFLLFTISASCVADSKKNIYANSELMVVLKGNRQELIYVELINKRTSSSYFAVPKLMLYDDGEPIEGGLVADYNKLNNDDINSCKIEDMYSCDSIYSIETDSITMTLGQESRSLGKNKSTVRRLDLFISDSKLPDFVSGNYTLYSSEK